MTEEKSTQERKDTMSDGYDALIERMPEMEEAMKIALSSVSVVYNRSERMLYVYGEVRPAAGLKLSFNVELNAVLFDRNGRIIRKVERVLWQDDFLEAALSC